ncbi:MAG: CBS domain-containing protein [Bacteroidetes bacterium]|nr:MAG: CBS domain-containing protein [Bacteroidota bacterium]RLD70635.1 MAG: CBS domain-containing protein [Bacteroidota bacterium]RLD88432.1 MAG: CBS domain-containing protein [Bacteroidota bacterium]
MIARHLITEDILPLKTSTTGEQALSLMEELKVSHLPIVNNEVFLGLISEQDILDFNNVGEPLGNYNLSLKNPYVNEHQHLYDVLKLVSELKLTLIPVLDDHERYIGCITLFDLVNYMAGSFSLENPGGIIVLEMSQNDYNLTEIAQIVESNDAKILSLFLASHSDSTRLEVAVKLNKTDLGGVLQTFDRYGYFVKVSFNDDEDRDDIKENYDSLMNYLNI